MMTYYRELMEQEATLKHMWWNPVRHSGHDRSPNQAKLFSHKAGSTSKMSELDYN